MKPWIYIIGIYASQFTNGYRFLLVEGPAGIFDGHPVLFI
jgi:hypothetical protein